MKIVVSLRLIHVLVSTIVEAPMNSQVEIAI